MGAWSGPSAFLLPKVPPRLPNAAPRCYSLPSPRPETLPGTQEQRARFTLVTKSSGASQRQITP